jgi:Glycine transporter
VFASLLRRFGTPFIVLDAMATGLFTVVGVEKALLYDLPDASAIFVGVAAGVGGGLFVDLIAGRPVGMVHRGPWNATAALAGAVFYAVLANLDAPTGFRQAGAFAVVVAMRLASLRWGLQTPLPDDLVRKFTPRRYRGDADAAEDNAAGAPQLRHQLRSRAAESPCGGRAEFHGPGVLGAPGRDAVLAARRR